MLSKLRVFTLAAVLMVLPCIGSHSHTTRRPARLTARSKGGSAVCTRPAPMRLMSVRRPAAFSGFSTSMRRSSSSGVVVGPTLRPTGLCTPRRNSTWAPSICRVRSPIHRKWAEHA